MNNLIKKNSSLFHDFKKSIENNSNKWLKNLTNVVVPHDIEYIFCLGPRFSLPINQKHRKNFTIEFISSIESKLIQMEKTAQLRVDSTSFSDDDIFKRTRFILSNLLYNFYKKRRFSGSEQFVLYNSIERDLKKAKSFLKNHPNLYLLRADKGNITVITYKDDYNEKMLSILNDQNTYKTLNSDPTYSIQKNNNLLFKQLLQEEFIEKSTYYNLISYNGISCKIYGLIKVHKDNNIIL